MNPVWAVPGYRFDLSTIRAEVSLLRSEFPDATQIGLTHRPGITDETEKIFDGTGSLYDYDTSEFKAKESDFTVFNKRFYGTYFYDIYKSFPDIGRFRIMIAKPYSCYSMHIDTTDRYHIPVITNPNAYLVFPHADQPLNHIRADGGVYKANTRQPHTAINSGKEDRIHLLLDDISTE